MYESAERVDVWMWSSRSCSILDCGLPLGSCSIFDFDIFDILARKAQIRRSETHLRQDRYIATDLILLEILEIEHWLPFVR
jgi:hypothetical protein